MAIEIVDLPIDPLKMVVFHGYVNVYQMVLICINSITICTPR